MCLWNIAGRGSVAHNGGYMRVNRKPQTAGVYRQYLNAALDLFYPTRCAVCESRSSDVLCCGCHDELPIISGERCDRCGLPTVFDTPVCEGCKGVDYGFDTAVAPVSYGGVGKQLVRALKYDGDFAVARRVMVPLMVGSLVERRYERVVAVPMHPSRRRMRGFNQAEVLAQEVAGFIGVEVSGGFEVLRRVRDQVELSAVERRRNVHGAFRFGGRIKGTVLLVDDVFTTGATMSECASELIRAGAGEVHAVSFCRTC